MEWIHQKWPRLLPEASAVSRVVVGLSGGVDSAVTAWLLKQQGHEVIGVFMKNWDDDQTMTRCASEDAYADALAVGQTLGIEVRCVNLVAIFKDRVFFKFLDEYRAGRTPNPDILCNTEIKFRAFLDHALSLGADHIATGHYVRVRQNLRSGRYELLKGVDATKDQSYFLHRLDQTQLARAWFPIGAILKTQIRRMAEGVNLPNARKKDSTGICFVGGQSFCDFLGCHMASSPGPIKDDQGRIIGQHGGLGFYTLGQRQGLGIGGLKGGQPLPWYVARKDMASNTLWVVQGSDHPWLMSQRLRAENPSWVAGFPPESATLQAKVRYQQVGVDCTLSEVSDSGFTLDFPRALRAVTPGQSAALYDGEVCLGGGIIAGGQHG